MNMNGDSVFDWQRVKLQETGEVEWSVCPFPTIQHAVQEMDASEWTRSNVSTASLKKTTHNYSENVRELRGLTTSAKPHQDHCLLLN